jgi:type IV pilus assembly protein PilF
MKLSRFLVAALAIAALAACETNPDRKAPTRSENAAKFNTQLGVNYMQQGNLALAQEKLERALKQNPKDPNVHVSLAVLSERLGDSKRADSYYRSALRLAPDNPEISNTYAVYQCKNNHVDDGVKLFDSVAANRLYRSPEVALTNAGVCLRTAKRYEEAEQRFTQALRTRPNYSEACVQLAGLYLERSRAGDALQVIDNYVTTYLPNADVLLYGVTVARAAKDRSAEERYSRKLRTEFPDSEQARILKRNER